jgi:uncharacterized membrane protein YcaP (DUF421 family)
MIGGLFAPSTSLWQVGLRAVIIYLAVIVGLRLFGKREIGQLSTLDLVVLLLAGNTFQNAMTGPDTSVTAGIVVAAVLFTLNWLLARYGTRIGLVQRVAVGVPTVLVTDGQVNQRILRREGISTEELEAALRGHGVTSIDRVELAVLEVDGTISVVPRHETMVRVHPRFLRDPGNTDRAG